MPGTCTNVRQSSLITSLYPRGKFIVRPVRQAKESQDEQHVSRVYTRPKGDQSMKQCGSLLFRMLRGAHGPLHSGPEC